MLKWLHDNQELFVGEFAEVGTEGKKLVFDGPKDYLFYCSGRDFIDSLTCQVQLKSRHDLLNWIVLDRFFNFEYTVDSIVYTVELDNTLVDSMCFSIVWNEISKLFVESRFDVKNFTTKIQNKSFKDGFSICSDNVEIINKILENGELVREIENCLGEKIVQEISCSDLSVFEPEEIKSLENVKNTAMVLRVRCVLPKQVEMQHRVTKLVLLLSDFIAQNGKLTTKSKQSIDLIRSQYFAPILKQQQLDRIKVYLVLICRSCRTKRLRTRRRGKKI